MSAPGVPSLKKGAYPLGDVLDVDHGNALSVGLLDGPLDVLKHDIRVPQRELATGEVVVLKINHQQCLRHRNLPRVSIHLQIHFPARSTLIHSISILNGPAFLSPNRKPTELISSGFTAPASLTTRPNEVASNLSSGTLTSIHSSFFVCTVARYEKAVLVYSR